MEKKAPLPSLHLKLQTDNEYGLWTGGASGAMDGVKTTSILGGLRFWTGALLRANGAHVCEDRSCTADTKRKKTVCELCELFGCTGLSRLFSLSIENQSAVRCQQPIKKDFPGVPLEKYAYVAKNGQNKTPTYYLPKAGSPRSTRTTHAYCGPLELSLRLHRPHNGTFVLPDVIPTAFYLMLTYGTLGAQDQYGCGLTRFAEKSAEEAFKKLCLPKANACEAGLGISLRDFFFFKGTVKGDARNAMAEIRYCIRSELRKKNRTDLRHWFCGSLGKTKIEDPSGSKYNFSIDSRGQLYGWGYFPRKSHLHEQFTQSREEVLDIVHSVLARDNAAGKSLVWRECMSKRDTCGKKTWPDFYADLLHEAWRKA